jgi:RNA polymerase sigma factor (sigma-70 family)
MDMNLQAPTVATDEQLWLQACEGDRDAFTKIVERYQSLVCSLAYSACGALGTSEDMAQETFIAAWHRLKELREPSKLRQWLCGIVRNITANALRRDLRRGGESECLETVVEATSSENDPATQTITREEEALLWRTLADMPVSYREPLVLFYREEKSIVEVAALLDLTEDTVKQRLSRGRAMLREEMAALIETTLTRTKPGSAFTVGVLVALPMVSASTASAAMTASAVAGTGASASGKGMLAKLGLGALIGPVIGLAFAWLGTRAAASTARTRMERDCILRYTWRWIIPFCFVMSIGLAAVLSQAGKLYPAAAGSMVTGVGVWTAMLVGGVLYACRRMEREVKRIRIETNTTGEAHANGQAAKGEALRLPKYFETRPRFLGLPLFAMAWGGNNACGNRPRAVYGWLAVGNIAVSPILAIGGVAVAPVAVGAISVGVLSLSIFWGMAIGVLAVGSLAFGWWALGCAAAGLKCAVGFAAVAREYAVGFAASATETGAAAKEWLTHEWLTDLNSVILHQIHWWILLCVAVALSVRTWRSRSRHCLAVGNDD